MKLGDQILRGFVDLPVDINILGEQLTMLGLELEDITPACPSAVGVISVRVVAVSRHPNAQNLSSCEIECGRENTVQVVCGANNVREGMVTAWAAPGTVLLDERKIDSMEIRGLRSDGMLCSEHELGWSEDVAGIIEFDSDTPVGVAVDTLLPTAEHIIDIAITPNRGDCLSALGIAREIATVNGISLSLPEKANIPVAIGKSREVVLEDTACGRYLGRVIENVDTQKISPFWLRRHLQNAGIRPLTAVVDITNYVMLELGQPLHAFDNERLQGDIHVRAAHSGESLQLLDGQMCALQEETLLICDDHQPLALAGIMGGQYSAVHEDTCHLFLECAWFSPLAIAGKARQYALETESAYRFERGVDPQIQDIAIERATALILQICGGNAGPLICREKMAALPQQDMIFLRWERITSLLGITITEDKVQSILTGLGMTLLPEKDGLQVTIPSWRFDLREEEDLIEEVARVYGYDNIPNTYVRVPMQLQERCDEGRQALTEVCATLVSRMYQEVITWSFVDPEWQKKLHAGVEPIVLSNPISPNMSQMRVSLWTGLLETLRYNIHRQCEQLRLFETGCVFSDGKDGLQQNTVLGGICNGKKYKNQWDGEKKYIDFYDVKGDVEAILTVLSAGNALQSPVTCRSTTHPALHPGQSAAFFQQEVCIAICGKLHPAHAEDLGITDIYLFEIYIENIKKVHTSKKGRVSPFPPLQRDLTLLLPVKVTAAQVQEIIQRFFTSKLIECELFDVYQGGHLKSAEKSLSFSLIFQSYSGTLSAQQIDSDIAGLLSELETECGARLRES